MEGASRTAEIAISWKRVIFSSIEYPCYGHGQRCICGPDPYAAQETITVGGGRRDMPFQLSAEKRKPAPTEIRKVSAMTSCEEERERNRVRRHHLIGVPRSARVARRRSRDLDKRADSKRVAPIRK
jgi:hypothetical protein